MRLIVGHGETEAASVRTARGHARQPVGSVIFFDNATPSSTLFLTRVAGQHAVDEASSTNKPVIAVVCQRSKKRPVDSDECKDAFIAWGLAVP